MQFVDCWLLESVNMIGKVLKLQPRLIFNNILLLIFCVWLFLFAQKQWWIRCLLMYYNFCEFIVIWLFWTDKKNSNEKVDSSLYFYKKYQTKKKKYVWNLLLHSLFLLISCFSLPILAPNNFKGLLLRSDVLYRLNHYQSSLADVDNALKSRPSSYKVSKTFTQHLLKHTHTQKKCKTSNSNQH